MPIHFAVLVEKGIAGMYLNGVRAILRKGVVEFGGQRVNSVPPDGSLVKVKEARCFGMFQFLRPRIGVRRRRFRGRDEVVRVWERITEENLVGKDQV